MAKFLLLILTTCLISSTGFCASAEHDLPAGTRVFLVLDQAVSSKRGDAEVGQLIQCRVWRDVTADGLTFVRSGTPATCKIGSVRHRNIGGFEGKVSIAGLDTTDVAGNTAMLSGGYNKEGNGRKAAVWTVGLLLFWPALFVPGGAAELPPGTIFDTYTANVIRIAAEAPALADQIQPGVDPASRVEVVFLKDRFEAEEKPEYFEFRVTSQAAPPSELAIDSVNGKAIQPLVLKADDPTDQGGLQSAVYKAKIKSLTENLQKGINVVQVAFNTGGVSASREVILDVQL